MGGEDNVQVVEGGLSCNSGIQIEELGNRGAKTIIYEMKIHSEIESVPAGDRSDEMVIAVVAVVVGYGYASADQCMSSLCAAATETSS